MDKSVPRVTVWHHSAKRRDAKTMTLGTDLPIRTSNSCQILIFHCITYIEIHLFTFCDNKRGIKRDFPFINIHKVLREVLKTEGEAKGIQRFLRDLANVNE